MQHSPVVSVSADKLSAPSRRHHGTSRISVTTRHSSPSQHLTVSQHPVLRDNDKQAASPTPSCSRNKRPRRAQPRRAWSGHPASTSLSTRVKRRAVRRCPVVPVLRSSHKPTRAAAGSFHSSRSPDRAWMASDRLQFTEVATTPGDNGITTAQRRAGLPLRLLSF